MLRGSWFCLLFGVVRWCLLKRHHNTNVRIDGMLLPGDWSGDFLQMLGLAANLWPALPVLPLAMIGHCTGPTAKTPSLQIRLQDPRLTPWQSGWPGSCWATDGSCKIAAKIDRHRPLLARKVLSKDIPPFGRFFTAVLRFWSIQITGLKSPPLI